LSVKNNQVVNIQRINNRLDGGDEMPFGKHLIEARSLMGIIRYQNKFCFKERSVAEHMWSVAKIAQGLAIWEKSKFLNNVDMGVVLEKAINHDLIEQCTGDILGPTKKRTPAMIEAIEEIEALAFTEEIAPELPSSWREPFREYILNPKTTTLEGQIIRAADIIDTMIEAIEEIQLGNVRFRKVLIDSSEALIKVDLESVRYFIKYALIDFDLDIAEYFGSSLSAFREQLEFSEEIFKRGYR
jgi:putative hydrolases of HD superfamily